MIKTIFRNFVGFITASAEMLEMERYLHGAKSAGELENRIREWDRRRAAQQKIPF